VSDKLRFLTDEDFRGKLLRGLKRRLPEANVVRVQDEGLLSAEDPVILEWAAQHDHIVLTHDADTMTHHAYARVAAGQRMPGVCVIPQSLGIGRAIEELLVVIECSVKEDWENQVRFLPL
jgi:hypothetical protein